MSSHNNYTNKELSQITSEAIRGKQAEARASLQNKNAFISFLNLIGIGWIVDAYNLGTWGWNQLKGFFRRVFSNPKPWGSFQRISCSQSLFGIKISIDFTVNNLKNTKCYAVAYFMWENNTYLLSSNKKYQSKTGQLCVAENFTPTHNIAKFTDLNLLIPSREFSNLLLGITHNLKYQVYLRKSYTDEIILVSRLYKFKYNRYPFLGSPRAVIKK